MTRADEERELERALEDGDLRFGELVVRRIGGGYEIRGPGEGAGAEDAPEDPEALRRWSRLDARGRYRPLSGMRDMRGNWRWTHSDLSTLLQALEAIYPLAWRHRCLRRRGELRVVAADEVLTRQSGRYESAANVDDLGIASAVSILCVRCVRTPVWHAEQRECVIPCPEPCGVFVALAREAAVWEQEQAAPGSDDPDTAFAAFEDPGNAIRNAYLRARRSRAS